MASRQRSPYRFIEKEQRACYRHQTRRRKGLTHKTRLIGEAIW